MSEKLKIKLNQDDFNSLVSGHFLIFTHENGTEFELSLDDALVKAENPN